MSLSLIVVALGAVVAAVGTGVVTAGCARRPQVYLAAWAVALFGLAIALGAQTVGDLAGYSAVMFRAMELGAQVIAPLAICLGLAELVGKSLPARFAMRLAVSAIAVISLVVLGTDPLNPVLAFSTHWPNPAVYYEVVPKAVLAFLLAPFTVITVIVGALMSLARSGRGTPSAGAAQPVLAAALAALALSLPGLAMLLQHAGLSLPAGNRVFAPVCLVAAGLTWLAAMQASRRGLAERAGPGAGQDAADWDGADEHSDAGRWAGQDTGPDGAYQAGEFDGYETGAGQPFGRLRPPPACTLYPFATLFRFARR